ncbi:NADPH:quinone oxidoreductase family protein [Geodermatophilus sabuli]|uniref:NADPH2:quinone reductase n=1 Tax=Geodermatophilus sabuli TaxID=1564158 RepID=A0A285EAQ5_9ACTN|nr:NADPH:quinone oxidoreductase family protein [Geodermatophilus sabuli]MBB3085518.1 NADPH2:quinone reductase [Geodermatophilus sabuli]SNX96060.1 NADPH2:quinone reductase [Geodermatophilus sabuli]
MRAAVITALTGPDAVEVRDVPDPVAEQGQVLVDVEFAGVVFPDVLQTRGEYQLRPEVPFSPGWEVAGVVREDAGGFKAGDRVAAMPVIGGFAETVAIDADMVFPLPDGVPFDKGAAVPLNYLTMHFALLHRAQLRAGETVLVHGAAGGVGTAACQLAAAYGARVIAVVSSPEKGEVARAAGAHEVVPVEGFRDEVRRLTDGRGVDVVVDPVGGDRFTDSLRSLARDGRLVVLGFTGRDIPTVKVNRLLLTNTTVMGAASMEFWRTEPGYVGQQWRDLMPLMESGAIDPPIGSVFALDQAAAAIEEIDQRRAAGRVLLRVREGTASR